ncbi:MAG: L,D-transpeptidase family protein [Nevskia sp.]|nr:L,D-transpeptidase family protein [Nevskia sp.]
MPRPTDALHRLRRPFTAAILAAAVALPAWCWAVADPPRPEQELLAAIDNLRSGDSGAALKNLEDLVKREPNFRLAQLLYGQVLAERSGVAPATPLVDISDPRVRDLLDEYRVRVAEAEKTPPPDALPSPILKLSARHRYAIVADLPRSRVYVLQNVAGTLHRIGDYYATIARNGFGKRNAGDLRTPVGVYRVTGFTPGGRLPPFYGAGAYPLDYPNAWDRAHGRTGSGIWLHGVPQTTYSRPPHASEGCVVLANSDLIALRSMIVPGATPVVLSDRVDWLSPAQLELERNALLHDIEDWRQKWSRLDTDAYLDYYDDNFHSDDGMGKPAFAAYKRRVNQGRRRIEVRLSDIDLFSYPGEPNVVLAEFTQLYRSDNYSSTSHKEQYWRRGPDGAWKILREESRDL